MNLPELRERLAQLNSQAHEIYAAAEGEKRDLSVEETEKVDAILAGSDRTKADIDRLEKLASQTDLLTRPAGRKTAPEAPAAPGRAEEGDDWPRRRPGRPDSNPYALERDGGFRSLGNFALAVRTAVTSGFLEPRLQKLAAAATYGSEGAGGDGGFAVPPEFRSEIMQTVLGEDSLLSRCDQISTQGNTFTQPVDETTPWQTSGGILANWEGEAAAAFQSKPQLQERTVKLNKLRCLVPLTEELLEDAAAMDGYLRRKAPQKIAFKINSAIVAGTGAGMPLGILPCPAKVTVPKESGQLTGTVIAKNVMRMFNRCYAGSRSSSVWLYNPEVEPQLWGMSIPGTDNTGAPVTTWGVALYQPPGGLSATPYGTLMGRPCIPTQACSSLSTEGDLILCDLSQYLALLKSGPNPKLDVSMHLWFDQDLTAFKFVVRMGGVPWWSAPAQPAQGSNSYSPFVTLQSR